MHITLALFGVLNLTFKDLLDILLVALLIYFVIRWLKDSAAFNIVIALLMMYVFMVVVDALDMKMMSRLFSTFLDVGVVAIIVIFQPEIRHFLLRIGSGEIGSRSSRLIATLFGGKREAMDGNAINELTEACRSMSEDKTGALIVIPHKINLNHIIDTGDRIDANVNRRLIMNIFFKNSPLHDGAMIVENGRIVAARCTLPITQRTDIPPHYGMRHKAAFGMTEESDAEVVVVSEETGTISYFKEGEVTTIGNINELKIALGQTDQDKVN